RPGRDIRGEPVRIGIEVAISKGKYQALTAAVDHDRGHGTSPVRHAADRRDVDAVKGKLGDNAGADGVIANPRPQTGDTTQARNRHCAVCSGTAADLTEVTGEDLSRVRRKAVDGEHVVEDRDPNTQNLAGSGWFFHYRTHIPDCGIALQYAEC